MKCGPCPIKGFYQLLFLTPLVSIFSNDSPSLDTNPGFNHRGGNLELKKFLECGAARAALSNLSFKIQTVRKMGAPIYWSGASIYWSPKILFSIFWKGMKREGYDKTRFCVSREGLLNVTGTFSLP